MGHAVPDRLFWAHDDDLLGGEPDTPAPDSTLDTTRH